MAPADNCYPSEGNTCIRVDRTVVWHARFRPAILHGGEVRLVYVSPVLGKFRPRQRDCRCRWIRCFWVKPPSSAIPWMETARYRPSCGPRWQQLENSVRLSRANEDTSRGMSRTVQHLYVAGASASNRGFNEALGRRLCRRPFTILTLYKPDAISYSL